MPGLRILITGIILSLIPVSAWAQDCPELRNHERVRLSAVHDGDTLRLTDGRRVRLLAINAPELASDGKPAQPFARASREAAEDFFADTDSLYLSFESRRTDRYGRLLAHAIHPSGRNLEQHLVRQGLALPLAVPPDFGLAPCLEALAAEAREAGRGLWQSEYWQPLPSRSLDDPEPAFRRVCGRISRVDRQQGLWLELRGDLVIRIDQRDFPWFRGTEFAPQDADYWSGRWLEVSGWLQDRRDNEALMERGYKPWSLQARSPYALRWLSGEGECR